MNTDEALEPSKLLSSNDIQEETINKLNENETTTTDQITNQLSDDDSKQNQVGEVPVNAVIHNQLMDSDDYVHGLIQCWIIEYACKNSNYELFQAIKDDPRAAKVNPSITVNILILQLFKYLDSITIENPVREQWNVILESFHPLNDIVFSSTIIAREDILKRLTQLKARVLDRFSFWFIMNPSNLVESFQDNVKELHFNDEKFKKFGQKLLATLARQSDKEKWISHEQSLRTVGDLKSDISDFLNKSLIPNFSNPDIFLERIAYKLESVRHGNSSKLVKLSDSYLMNEIEEETLKSGTNSPNSRPRRSRKAKQKPKYLDSIDINEELSPPRTIRRSVGKRGRESISSSQSQNAQEEDTNHNIEGDDVDGEDDDGQTPRSSKLPRVSVSPSDRKRNPWSEEEIENLHKGMEMYGKQWALILKNFEFNGRTNVDLKDKWRGIQRVLEKTIHPS
eukprot:c15845_g1_i3.p1 GENE.c15845_g1_i3~~c15845_g1_i3.p1  ORF type:complete len:459 (+),score=132.46 c15845_g1_i3:24-1379(+)